MAGLFSKFRERSNQTAQVTELGGGIHDNVEIVHFQKDVKSVGDYKRYLLTKFKKFDEDGNAIGEFTNSYIELDPSSSYIDFKVESLLKQLHNLAVALFGDEWRDHFDPFKGLLKKEADAHHEKVKAKLKTRAFVKELEKNILDQVEAFMEEYFENKDEEKFSLKLVYNKNGYLQIPNGKFIKREGDDSIVLNLSDNEMSNIKKFSSKQ